MPTAQARAILDQLTTVIVATGENQRRADQLLPADYRHPIERQPLQGGHRRFALDLTGGRNSPHGAFGAGVAFFVFDMKVSVAYFRGGGSAGAGDRIGSNIAAATDSMLLADALILEEHWNRDVTGIREIKFEGSERAVDGGQSEVWQTRFLVEFEMPFPL